MDTRLRVLYIEDEHDYVILVHRLLSDAGYNLSLEHVDNPELLRTKFASNKWDLIISDYCMPSFTGTDAVKIIRESNKEIPIIILSGTMNECQAEETIAAGANCYVMKNQLTDLVPLIKLELEKSREN